MTPLLDGVESGKEDLDLGAAVTSLGRPWCEDWDDFSGTTLSGDAERKGPPTLSNALRPVSARPSKAALDSTSWYGGACTSGSLTATGGASVRILFRFSYIGALEAASNGLTAVSNVSQV